MRKQGFITYINPSMQKGATLFLRLVNMAKKKGRDWTFLAVEGRQSMEHFQKQFKVDLAQLPNLWWIPNQWDIRPVYRRTAVLLFPSYWLEASGRSIAEAQLGGIPVLASNHGGMPEQINGGGYLFDIPERYRNDSFQMPTEDEARPWFEVLVSLMEDDNAYAGAVKRAKDAGRFLHPDRVQNDAVAIVEALLNPTD